MRYRDEDRWGEWAPDLPGARERLPCLQPSEPRFAVRDILPILRAYHAALSGTSRELVDVDDAYAHAGIRAGLGRLFLPAEIDPDPAALKTYEWYLVALAHAALHGEVESQIASMDLPAQPSWESAMDVLAAGGAGQWSNPLSILSMFEPKALAVEVFVILDDSRIDATLRSWYRGLSNAYARVAGEALRGRPRAQGLTRRTAALEVLIRASLGAVDTALMDARDADAIYLALGLQAGMLSPSATVEDSVRTALRLLPVLAAVPDGPIVTTSLARVHATDALSTERAFALWEEHYAPLLNLHFAWDPAAADPTPRLRCQPIPFRDDLAERLLLQFILASPVQPRKDQAKEPLGEAYLVEAEFAQDSENADASIPPDALADAMASLEELPPDGTALSNPPVVNVGDDVGGNGADQEQLVRTDPRTYLYPEWDYRVALYRPNWCLLQENRPTGRNGTGFWQASLAAYANLIPEIRRQMEMLLPTALLTRRRLWSGDEVDFDSAVEALVDYRVGVTPSDRVYQRKERIRRRVAVAVLLDLSVSTLESVETELEPGSSASARTGKAPAGIRQGYRSIIDIEKESLVLLIEALELVGDAYGIYGFSGCGRRNVQFFVIKDLQERFSPQIPARVSTLRPLGTTRMGPSIRHTVRKLRSEEAETKFLFLVSDGRPSDVDYGDDDDPTYALRDTKAALDEAKSERITPFCLTVDSGGEHYLAAMCGDIGYEVIRDVDELPQRLLALYGNLAAKGVGTRCSL